eukprot:Lithocolla_globosa_v1_NODE_224_length_5048_cov_4.479976.p5 type:complete len:112 gc:universal NODE_224_length_5048_cov_4.479976:1297-1632(+)
MKYKFEATRSIRIPIKKDDKYFLRSISFIAKKKKDMNREDIREFAQKKRDVLVDIAPGQRFAICLQYKGFINHATNGWFTQVGEPVKMHGDDDDDYDECVITSFCVMYSFD